MVGVLVKVYLTTAPGGPCRDDIARVMQQHFLNSPTLGHFDILDNLQLFDDLVQISELYTAYKGDEDLEPKIYLKENSSVTLILPKKRYLNDYRVPWKKDTLILTDQFYSLLRTMYRLSMSIM